jgi:multicomponent Na+:H+ antiporter subunit D
VIAVPIAVPWVVAAVLLLLDGRRRAVGWTALTTLAVTLVVALVLAARVLRDGPVESVIGGWPGGVGIALRADPLGILFAVTSLAALLAALAYEVVAGVHERPFPALVLFLAAGLTGLFLTADVFNFYVFFEVSMAASFVLATYGREQREVLAALVFTVVNLVGSVMFLGAVAGLYHLTGSLDMRIIAGEPGGEGRMLVSVLLFVALALKLGLFPFHFWLPPIYRDAWPAIVAILAGAVANIGSYGLLRFGGDVLAAELAAAGPVVIAFGAASIVYGGHQAVSVRTPAETLAYSSIGQAGYVLVGLGLGGPLGFAGATLYALLNALNKTLLFLAVGLGGRIAAAAFVIGAFSVAGMPPASGFFGKAALFRAALDAEHPWVLALLVLGAALSFVYMFQVYQARFWEDSAAIPRDATSSAGVVLIIAVLVLALGIWPEPLIGATERAASALRAVSP